MAEMIQLVQFKRGTKTNLDAILLGANIPKVGEPVWETDTNRIKIGDGLTPYKDLPYTSGVTEVQIYYLGYYFNGKFYTDSTYTTELPKDNQKIYIDQNNFGFYKYYGDSIGFKRSVAEASEVTPGIMKLYKTNGSNEDGTMTQKAISDGVSSIKFSVQATKVAADGDATENILVLSLPW